MDWYSWIESSMGGDKKEPEAISGRCSALLQERVLGSCQNQRQQQQYRSKMQQEVVDRVEAVGVVGAVEAEVEAENQQFPKDLRIGSWWLGVELELEPAVEELCFVLFLSAPLPQP